MTKSLDARKSSGRFGDVQSRIDNRGTHLPGLPCQLADVVALPIASFALFRRIRALAALVRRQFRRQIGVGIGQDVAAFPPVIFIQLAIEARHPRMNEPIQIVHSAKRRKKTNR